MSGLLNERITALRKERGFTQEQLGQMVGVSAQAVSKCGAETQHRSRGHRLS